VIRTIDLDHVAVAVERQADTWPRYAGDLAGSWLANGGSPGFRAAQLAFRNGMKIEVLEPYEVGRNDFLRRFLDRSGPGPHHLTFKVGDIAGALDEVASAGLQVVGVDLSDPGWKEAFIHPKQGRGVVVQLAQSEGSWTSPADPGLPPPRTDRPAHLDHVAHAVADLDDALGFFSGLLGGRETARGDGSGHTWVELAWPGPGRIRLLSPTTDDSPLRGWLGGRDGRVHHLAFSCDDPAGVAGATELGDGEFEVEPQQNLGVRLRLRQG
jgi:catechol 2,3-dioxygenase-like lactoylglutathione lyase family enzyme